MMSDTDGRYRLGEYATNPYRPMIVAIWSFIGAGIVGRIPAHVREMENTTHGI